jgi:hypothetical protein
MLIPHVVKRTRAAFDKEGKIFIKNVGVNGISLKKGTKEKEEYFIALLNSLIASFIISKISIFLSGGYYASNKQFASLIPIRRIDFTKPIEQAYHDKIVTLVDGIIELHKRLAEVKTPQEKQVLERQIEATDNEINQQVYKLYGLTEEEIRIVGGNV